jgi:cytochrome c553
MINKRLRLLLVAGILIGLSVKLAKNTAAEGISVATDVLMRHAPSLVATTKPDPKPEDWEDPEICGGCHERQVNRVLKFAAPPAT